MRDLPPRRRSATSILEVLLVMGILSLAATQGYQVWSGSRRTLEGVDARVDLQGRVRLTLDRLIPELRQSVEVLHPPAGRPEESWPLLSFLDPRGSLVAVYLERNPAGGPARLVRLDTNADSFETGRPPPEYLDRQVLAEDVEDFRVLRRGYLVDLQLVLRDPVSGSLAHGVAGAATRRELF